MISEDQTASVNSSSVAPNASRHLVPFAYIPPTQQKTHGLHWRRSQLPRRLPASKPLVLPFTPTPNTRTQVLHPDFRKRSSETSKGKHPIDSDTLHLKGAHVHSPSFDRSGRRRSYVCCTTRATVILSQPFYAAHALVLDSPADNGRTYHTCLLNCIQHLEWFYSGSTTVSAWSCRESRKDPSCST